jgi:hypothetical protein
MIVGPPLDLINTEDLSAAFVDIGKLLIWEKDPTHKERVLVKIRATDLEEISKSLRYTVGDAPDSESWTCSIEILEETLLGELPADEDPLPGDGVDPHPLPNEEEQLQQFLPPPVANEQANEADGNAVVEQNAEDQGWGHWAQPPDNNNLEIVEAPLNAAMIDLLNAVVPDEMDFQHDTPPPPVENSTFSGPSSAVVENDVSSGLVSMSLVNQALQVLACRAFWNHILLIIVKWRTYNQVTQATLETMKT